MRRAMDEVEIRNTIARIALSTDLGDLEEYAACFAEDAHFEMRVEPGQPTVVPPTKGRAAILASSKKRRASGTSGPGLARRPCHPDQCDHGHGRQGDG